MSFEKDVFISYAHLDNEPIPPDQQGWITRFHASLSALLSMRLGRKAAIWRDDKLQGNDVFADEIVEQFARTALFASVLTPRYMASDWCTREIREFCGAAERNGGLVLDRKSRVFKVLKTPVDGQDALPAGVKDALGYEFFTYENGVPLELDGAYGERFAQDYNRALARLAWEARELLKKIEETAPAAAQAPVPAPVPASLPATTIYLAECAYAERSARAALESELRMHGLRVLPDCELPKDEAAYVAAVEAQLAQCAISIHLVGAGYGSVPDGPSQKSVVVLQNELGARRSRDAGLRRLIWLPEGTRSDQPAQQAFIEALHTDAAAQLGADLVTGDIEQLKGSIHATVGKLAQRAEAAAAPATAPGERTVYLICDRRDRDAALPLRKHLKQRGIEAAIPAFEGSAAAVREANEDMLKTCDAVVLFYGAGDEAWKRTMDSELKKTKACRGTRPLLGVYTYLAGPLTPDKQELIDLGEPRLIDGLTGFAPAQMDELLRILTAAPAAA